MDEEIRKHIPFLTYDGTPESKEKIIDYLGIWHKCLVCDLLEGSVRLSPEGKCRICLSGLIPFIDYADNQRRLDVGDTIEYDAPSGFALKRTT